MREDLEKLLEKAEAEKEKWGGAADLCSDAPSEDRCLTRAHEWEIFAGEIRDILKKHQS